ncbi:MAG TPA: hypothetical protein VLF91_05225 [Candidatus Saccharimonadales bacterium]|nr:hypothetical protein [Candidatus Saccharimonadales bacterium]
MSEQLPLRSDQQDGGAPQILDAETTWRATQELITADFYERVVPLMVAPVLFRRKVASVEELDDGDQATLKEDIDKALRREEAFVKNVTTGVIAAISAAPDATEYLILFDLDETVARRSRDLDRPQHVIRPAVIRLMQYLQQADGRIQGGILSSRSQEHINEHVQPGGELYELTPYLDPSAIYSSRGVDTWSRMPRHTTNEHASSDFLSKLLICEDRLDAAPGTSIVVVDDLRNMREAIADEHFRAVALGADDGFWINI